MIADSLRLRWDRTTRPALYDCGRARGIGWSGLAEAVRDRDLSLLHAAGFHGVYADASHEDFD